MDTTELSTLIKTRRSIRVFQDKPVPEALLLQAVETATWAPNGGNAQNWRFSKRPSAIANDLSDHSLKRGDFLLKRVGRSCSQTLRLNRSLHNKQCSDCFFIVRPSKPSMAVRLLLATRVIIESSLGPLLVERGAGAPYVTENTLQALPVPLDIADLDVSLYRRYRYAVLRQNTQRIRAIEAEYRHQIGLVPATAV